LQLSKNGVVIAFGNNHTILAKAKTN
jgi:hypothetical protein